MRWEDIPIDLLEKYALDPPADLAVLLASRMRPQSAVLDVGCGGGRHLRFLKERGHHPVGIDPNRTAIRAVNNVVPDVPVHLMDLNGGLPFLDETFDGILSTYAIYHGLRSTIQSTIHECLRVLRPAGLLFVHLISVRDFKYGIGPEPEPGSFVDLREGEPEAIHHFFDFDEVTQLFGDLSVLDVTHEERALHPMDFRSPALLQWQHLCCHWVVKGIK
jgi:SAM-dependent methyltransferase